MIHNILRKIISYIDYLKIQKSQVKITYEEFSLFLTEEWLKKDKAPPQAKTFKGSYWFKPIQIAIDKIEPEISLGISK